MALPASFSIIHSEFNDFLFAQICEEESGTPLSVLSALTRLEIDPWAEAARLSDLPKALAVQALAPTIARLTGLRRDLPDSTKTAYRLVQLLPGPGRTIPSNSSKRTAALAAKLPLPIWLICLILGMAVLSFLR